MADRFRTPRKEKHWEFIPGSSGALTVDGVTFRAGLSFNAAATVIRMLGSYIIAPDSATVAQDMVSLVIGIGRVATDNAATGAGLPDPAGQPGYPWLYWADHELFFGGTSTDPNMKVSSVQASFDIRSMRKFKPNETLALVLQYADIQGAPPLRVNIGRTRVLIAQT